MMGYLLLYIAITVLIFTLSVLAICLPYHAYRRELSRLTDDNLDLRARLFASKGFAPPGVDLTERYVEKKEAEKKKREDPPNKTPPGPLEQVREKWTREDRRQADNGIDATNTIN